MKTLKMLPVALLFLFCACSKENLPTPSTAKRSPVFEAITVGVENNPYGFNVYLNGTFISACGPGFAHYIILNSNPCIANPDPVNVKLFNLTLSLGDTISLQVPGRNVVFNAQSYSGCNWENPIPGGLKFIGNTSIAGEIEIIR